MQSSFDVNVKEVPFIQNDSSKNPTNEKVQSGQQQAESNLYTNKRYRDLSELATTGKVTKEVEILGWLFNMKTLTVAQSSEVFRSIANIVDLPERANKYRIEVLIRAIDTINGVPLEDLCEGDARYPSEILNKRRKVIENWDQSLMMKVFEVYNNMMEESLAIVNLNLDENELKKNL